MAKQKLFDWKDRYIPDEKSIERSKRVHAELDRLGIENTFGTGCKHTEDEQKAFEIILSGKKVPKELEERLLKTKGNRLREKDGMSMEELDKIFEEFENDNK